MKREIKFRGKPIEAELPSGEKLHGGFVYGSLLQGNGLCRILVPVEGAFKNYRVDPETVGQFTGWRDGGGNEIYEGDIAVAYTYGQGYTGEVIFTEASFGIKTKADGILFAGDFHFIDVLGNVFDNPELLKGGAAMKVYISLPITGYSYTERRGKAATVYMNLLGKGFEPVSPMDNGLGEHDSRAAHMKADFRLLLDCDAIYLCRGWRKSQGCLAEKTVAEQCGMIVMEGGAE